MFNLCYSCSPVPTNLQIKFIKSLHQKKFRQESRLFICEGKKLLEEALRFRSEYVVDIFATAQFIDSHQLVHPKLIRCSQTELERMSALTTSPEVLTVMRFLEEPTELPTSDLHVYIDGISDPGNLGTILRTAEWFGLKSVILSPNSVDPYNTKVIQAAMGSLFRVHLFRTSLGTLLTNYHFDHILAATMDGREYANVSLVGKKLLILGSESHGISSESIKWSTEKVTIPNKGAGESLNVAVAGAILMGWFSK